MPKIIKNQNLSPENLKELNQDEIDWIYNALDCCVTHEVHEALIAKAGNIELATSSFSKTLANPVFEMSLRGVLIDRVKRNQVRTEFQEVQQRLEKFLKRLIEEGIGMQNFNYRSHIQLKRLFYGVMQIKPYKARNSYGVWTPSVNRECLEKIEARYFSAQLLCRTIMILRDFDKKISFLSTKLDEDNKMRTSYNIAGTKTGRLSSSESDYGTGTNQQNVTKKLRETFIADPGMKLCNVDLEQGDSRNVGAICWELFVESHGEQYAGSYLDACESGDLHTQVCRMAWQDIPWTGNLEEDKKLADNDAQPFYLIYTHRFMAKKLGHGTNYMGTPRTMAMHSKMPTKVIEDFQKKYFNAFPVIGNYEAEAGDNWHTWVQEQLDSTSIIISPLYNRQRRFYGRPDDNKTRNDAVAYAPQSMTADAIDQGLINLFRWNRVEILIQVHDSVLFQYPEELEDEIVPKALELLTIRHQLKRGREFYLPVDAQIGWNWNEQTLDKDGKLIGNEEGLISWKGPGLDLRKRPKLIQPKARSLSSSLGIKL